MGYEEPLPPLPTREQELKMINDLEKSWLDQSNFKWYMNEPLRTTKIEHSYELNKFYRQWISNFSLGLLLSGPLLVIPLGRFWHRTSSGVPEFYRPKFVYTQKPEYLQGRNWSAFKKQFPIWIILGIAYASYFTDRSLFEDEWMEGKRPRKMM